MVRIEIYNTALAKIGIEPLTSPEETRPEAVICNQSYQSAIDSLLCLAEWDFCMDRKILQESNEKPVFGFKHKFILPSDFIKLVECDCGGSEYALEGKQILTDSSSCRIVYCRRVTDCTEMPALVQECLAIILAEKISGTLTGNNNIQRQLHNDLISNALPAAKTANESQNYKNKKSKYWIDLV